MGKERIGSSKKRESQSKSKCNSEEETECVCVVYLCGLCISCAGICGRFRPQPKVVRGRQT